MMKFFRKYTKQLLAVFMALLLIVWLGGSALQHVFDRSQEHLKAPRAKVFGKTVLIGDMQGAFKDCEVLKSMNIQWEWMWWSAVARLGVRNMNELQQLVGAVRTTPLTPEEWFMLDAAARHHGIQVSEEELERFKTRHGLTGEILASVRDRRGFSLDTLDEAIRSYVRVTEMMESAIGAIKASEADIQDAVRNSQEKVSVGVVTLDAAKFVDNAWQPTPEELQKQFDQGKDKDPAPSPTGEQVFGYREPEKAQIEYIRVDASVLAKRQKISEDTAWEYWESHQDEFLKPTSQPASAPPGSQPQPEKYGTFTEAKPKVIERLAQRAAQAEAQRLANEIISTLAKPWTGAPTTQPDNYAVPPPGQDSDRIYPDLITSLEPRYPGVLKYGRTTLQDQQGLRTAYPDITSAYFKGSGQYSYVSLPQAAFMVAGLEAKKDANPDHTRLFRNVYQTCAEPFADWSGNVVVFRTVATRAKQPAPSVDSVREKLITDLRKIQAGKEVERLAKELADKAGTAGLKAAFEGDANLVAKLGKEAYKDRVTFARGTRYVPEFRGDTELVKKCFAVATAPAASQPSQIITQQLKNQSNWVVVEWHQILPVTTQEYDQERAVAISRVLGTRQLAFLRNWFDPAHIRSRVGWEDLAEGKDLPTGPIEKPVLPPGGWGE
ncbi:MAG: hypothetical protein KA354_24205 [Phycisphaerae bacterium]|nr:hypothetical protein [Phycisphaerae bacterium]